VQADDFCFNPDGKRCLSQRLFGGVFQRGELGDHNKPPFSGCEGPNVMTGDCTCPQGFRDIALDKTIELSSSHPGTWDEYHYCVK